MPDSRLVGRTDRSASEANPSIITGTIWRYSRCGAERKRRVVPAAQYNAVASMIREVSAEVVLLPVSTLNAIAERAESAEREIRRLKMQMQDMREGLCDGLKERHA